MSASIPAPKPQLRRSGISPDDARALTYYFGVGGLSRLAQSSTGAQLDAARRFGQSKRCPCCNGIGRVDERNHRWTEQNDDYRRREIAWTISTVVYHRVSLPALSEYRRLRDEKGDRVAAEVYRLAHLDEIRLEVEQESGAQAVVVQRWIDSEVKRIREDERKTADQWCRNCRGRGWVGTDLAHQRGELTARPTGSSIKGNSGFDLGDAAMERLGRVAVRLSRIRVIDPRHVEVLAAYYAPQSGGCQALWGLTPAGKTLLRQNPSKVEGVSDEQLFADIVAAQRASGDPKLAAQLLAAHQQARELIDAAHDAWRSCDTSKPRKRPRDPKKARIKAPVDPLRAELVEILRQLAGAAE